MRYPYVCTAVCLLLLANAGQVYAQKFPLKAAAKNINSAAIKKSVKATSNAAIARKWKADALQPARQVNKLSQQAFFKYGAVTLPQLVDITAFRVYTKDIGVVDTMTDLWSSLFSGLHVAYFGPGSHSSPLEMRKQLLQNEARLNYAAQNWLTLKPMLLKHASAADYTRFAESKVPTRFFFEDSPRLDVFSKEIAAFGSGRKDAVSIMAAGQQDIETLYRQMLAFAHGKGAFPMRTSEVYRFLALQDYTQAELADLQKNLNSLECDMLRSWGWSDRKIRQVIALYRSKDWMKAYKENDFFPALTQQYELISSWRKYWENARQTDLQENIRMIKQLSEENR